MAQECNDKSSLAFSSFTPTNWCELHHGSSSSSWTTNYNTSACSPWQQQSNHSSNSSCEEDVSMSNASGLTVDDSSEPHVEPSDELIGGEHASDGKLWSHNLLSIGSSGDQVHNTEDMVGENLLDDLYSNSFGGTMLIEPIKRSLLMDSNNWEFLNDNSRLINNISMFHSLTYNNNTDHSTPCEILGTQRYSAANYLLSCYGYDRHSTQPVLPPGPQICRSQISVNNTGGGYHNGLNNNNILGDNSKYNFSATDVASTSARNFTFSSRLSNGRTDSRKQNLQTASPMGKEKGTAKEVKKKRCEDTSEIILRKHKQELSTVSSVKTQQAPKVKHSERITALQQIVSPFGRTDTASVLYEAIQYIKFLQEQVQLLTNPYMNTTSHKESWGGFDRKEKGNAKVDLRSRGLCLVPISCTPRVYHETTGSDYWTPTYRGCLYR